MRNDFNSNYLAHFGIMGMKWGVRRYQNADGSLTPEGKARYGGSGEGKITVSQRAKTARNILKSDSGSRSSKALKEARRKDMDELTTQELRDINNRLNEEQRYLNLTRGMTSDGKRFAKEMGKAVVSGVVTGVFIEVGKKFVKSKLGI